MTWEESRAWLISCLPRAAAYLTRETQEIRLRAGQPVVLVGKGVRLTDWQPTPEEILRAAEALTGRSLHARREEASRGALCVYGGHRLGLCGQTGPEGFSFLSGFCLRIAGQWPGAADPLVERFKEPPVSLLLIGPPGSGKTTVLRDLCRQWSYRGVQTALCDERGELAALWNGAAQLDVGPMTDVLTGCPKGKGILQLIRTVRPQAVFTDEMDRSELPGIMEAARCGVKVCATAHGAGLGDARKRFKSLVDCFDGYGVLANGQVVQVYDREGKVWE